MHLIDADVLPFMTVESQIAIFGQDELPSMLIRIPGKSGYEFSAQSILTETLQWVCE